MYSFFQVEGCAAFEKIFAEVFAAYKTGYTANDEPADDGPGDEGFGDEGFGDEEFGSGDGSRAGHEEHLLAISQWGGVLTDDVS